jgi:hypothetical protein
MTRFLFALREYEASWPLGDEDEAALTRFRMSQALWASLEEQRTESEQKAEVDPDFSFVVFPGDGGRPMEKRSRGEVLEGSPRAVRP